MVVPAKQFTTDTWIDATWNEYLESIEHPACAKAKGYYHNGKYRIEMTHIGNDHAKAHANIQTATSLYAFVNHIDVDIRNNCSYCKTGIKEFQPDLSLLINSG